MGVDPVMGRSFVPLICLDTFKAKIQESGKPCSDFNPETFFVTNRKFITPPKASKSTSAHETSRAPPRLVSDQMVNIFCQEWAPLFPVLHRPTFLNLYAEYVEDPEGLKDQQSIAQLNLVFGIAALSAEVHPRASYWKNVADLLTSGIGRMLTTLRDNGKSQ